MTPTGRAADGRVRFAVKAAASVGLLGLIFAYAGPADVFATMRAMPVWLLASAFGLLLSEALLRAVNWLQMVRNAGGAMRLGTAVYAYFVGGFFGAILPSTLGTDVARSVVGATRTGTPVELLLGAAVTLNLISLAIVGASAVAAAAWLFPSAADSSGTLLMSGCAGAACVAAVAALGFWARRSQRRASTGVKAAARVSGLRGRIARFSAALRAMPTSASLAPIALVCVWSYLSRTLGLLILLTAVDAPVSFAALLTVGPVLALGAVVPATVLGFGAYQAAGVFMLAQWGVSVERALAASVAQSGLALLLYVVGCGIYLAIGRDTRAGSPLNALEQR